MGRGQDGCNCALCNTASSLARVYNWLFYSYDISMQLSSSFSDLAACMHISNVFDQMHLQPNVFLPWKHCPLTKESCKVAFIKNKGMGSGWEDRRQGAGYIFNSLKTI